MFGQFSRDTEFARLTEKIYKKKDWMDIWKREFKTRTEECHRG